MKLNAGKAKVILDSSKSAAIRAVKTYNDTDDNYRIETYISLMMMAYTKLFISFFYKEIGDRYYYKEKNGRFKKREGKKLSWSLIDCINEYEKKERPIDEGTKYNIQYFVGLRNEIEHNYIDERDLEKIIFGELQSLLYNYNKLLNDIFEENINKYMRMPLIVDFFNEDYKNIVASSTNRIIKYIENYKQGLPISIQNSDNFSFKFIAIPNTVNRNTAPAITFIRDEDILNQAVVAIKEKIVEKEIINKNTYKPQKIVEIVLEENNNLKYGREYTKYNASGIFGVLDIKNVENKNTNEKYCVYDAAYDSFVYKEEIKELLILFFDKIPKAEMMEIKREGKKISIQKLSSK